MEPVLVAKSLSKKYGRVVALDNSDLELYPGEVLGVIGDNGAGKSTLIKVLCGAVIPDSGEILLDGKNVMFTSPIEARRLGIETVYQNLALSPALSITDNMFLGRGHAKNKKQAVQNAAKRFFYPPPPPPGPAPVRPERPECLPPPPPTPPPPSSQF